MDNNIGFSRVIGGRIIGGGLERSDKYRNADERVGV